MAERDDESIKIFQLKTLHFGTTFQFNSVTQSEFHPNHFSVDELGANVAKFSIDYGDGALTDSQERYVVFNSKTGFIGVATNFFQLSFLPFSIEKESDSVYVLKFIGSEAFTAWAILFC